MILRAAYRALGRALGEGRGGGRGGRGAAILLLRGAEVGSPHGVRQMYWMFGLVVSMACTMLPASSGYELPPQLLVCPAGMFLVKVFPSE